MADVTYTYSIATDFPAHQVDSDRLKIEITESSITTAFSRIDRRGDNVDVVFVAALPSGEKTTLDGIIASHSGVPYIYPTTELSYYDNDPLFTDSITGKQYRASVMLGLIANREIFNDTSSPLYVPGFTPLVGITGSVANLNSIHSKTGWHEEQVISGLYSGPLPLLIYYGYPNSFNSEKNKWDNELVAQEMSKYSLIVFGPGVEAPSHPDHANAHTIINRIKALNASTLIFGYATANQTLSAFQAQASQWNDMLVHGIFMDQAGYDFSISRADLNEKIDYVHGLSSAKLCFANAWNTDHILGTANDPSYPNSTFNPTSAESKLSQDDWILLESFGSNTAIYTTTDGFEPKNQWADRVSKMISLRYGYGVNFAGIGVVENGNSNWKRLADFSLVASAMCSLEAYGTSDVYYGSSSARVDWHSRSLLSGIKDLYSMSPSVQMSLSDTDIYTRYLPHGKLLLDFSASAQSCSVEKFLDDPNSETCVKLVDDFIFGSSETGECGSLGWNFTYGTANPINAVANHPGIVRRTSSNTQDQISSMYPADTGSDTRFLWSEVNSVMFIFSLLQTDADFKIRLGLTSDATTESPAHGVMLEKLAADTNWFCLSINNSTPSTREDTGIAVSTDWMKLRIVREGGIVNFYFDDHLRIPVSTDIPDGTDGLLPFVQIVPTSTTARSIDLDYFKLILNSVSR